MLRRIAVSFALTLVCVAALPAIAGAQSTIAGVVKDASGAVLPGVTVEAKSDALIEKTRAVVTNGQGQYTIVDLRPGVYSLSFTLPGFSTFTRDRIELPANFTATISAELKVGGLEESVTVSGQSPVVSRAPRAPRCSREKRSTRSRRDAPFRAWVSSWSASRSTSLTSAARGPCSRPTCRSTA